jgi:uncharacterized protein YjhX (UPF0386 family)
MKIGHLFLSIFEIKKKVLKTKKLSIFSISLKLFGEMGSDRAVYSSVKGNPPRIIKRSLKNVILIKKYEIVDF